ncbi:FmdB family zinc ribbon protein [Paraburkholderia sp.]|uniref:FmdB family zinc ribbon protein n=1 Tax=Paraburkholderia sp. TaxID=1926495 RepID=UPI00239F5DEF|nr:FmdB family zinc ribbon protein [Paraburkholderia sp.]MDE1179594.1 zinc ribbon domain-containing protein [Paraburkholderia sp.]
MPIYAYRCESCGFGKDALQKMSDAPLTHCPECGKDTFRKQVTAAGFQLKGSGWYVTDFRGGNTNKGAAASGGESTGTAAPAAGDNAGTSASSGEAKAATATAASSGTSGASNATSSAPAAAPASSGGNSGS